jgi:UDP-N-acetylmuramoylalanine--D-glutamate ligase
MEGRAAIRVLRRHAEPSELAVVQDRQPDAAELDGAPFLTAAAAEAAGVLARAEVVVRSPGVSPHHGSFAELIGRRPEVVVTGGTQLWFAEAAATGALARTIAVTGSKGKSTTSSLIAHLLASLGVDAVLAGNVGRAPIELLGHDLEHGTRAGWTVLEVSSFQSSEVRHSPGIGVLTALFPEHLDWHGTVERYYREKCEVFRHPSPRCVVAVNTDNADVRAVVPSLTAAGAEAVPFGGADGRFRADAGTGAILDAAGRPLVSLAELHLPGLHNAVNLCGALTALDAAGFDVMAAAAASRGFVPLDHRLQVLGRLTTGALVVDDGLSTAPQAAVAALRAHGGPGVTILVGGHDRDLDYTPLATELAGRAVATTVVAMPESGPRILRVISGACRAAGNDLVRLVSARDLDDAVRIAIDATPADGVLLLSPAAPSFGRFADYRARSARFRELVGSIDRAGTVGTIGPR